jgi:hypothetical protein
VRIEEDGYVAPHPAAGRGGPLCPQSILGPGRNPLHAVREKMIDALYSALPKTLEGEFPELTPDSNVIYSATASTDTLPDHMSLYRMVALADSRDQPSGVEVEALYFQCHTCGFTLPANRVPPPAESNVRGWTARGRDTEHPRG